MFLFVTVSFATQIMFGRTLAWNHTWLHAGSQIDCKYAKKMGNTTFNIDAHDDSRVVQAL